MNSTRDGVERPWFYKDSLSVKQAFEIRAGESAVLAAWGGAVSGDVASALAAGFEVTAALLGTAESNCSGRKFWFGLHYWDQQEMG
jgi:hypothetical protein